MILSFAAETRQDKLLKEQTKDFNMPDGAKTLLVILFIPFLLALGHDVYFNYFSDDEKIRDVKALRIDPEEFLISDAGWIWNEYSPNTMQAARDMIGQETWESIIDPVLRIPTMLLGIIPWAAVAIYLLFALGAAFWPCCNSTLSFIKKRKQQDFTVYKNAKANSIKYKKK